MSFDAFTRELASFNAEQIGKELKPSSRGWPRTFSAESMGKISMAAAVRVGRRAV